MELSIFKDYFDYTDQTEPPIIFHRWALISAVSALLGRNVYVQFGHKQIYPTQYILLVGDPGSRKTTAIDTATALLKDFNYNCSLTGRVKRDTFLKRLSASTRKKYIPTRESGFTQPEAAIAAKSKLIKLALSSAPPRRNGLLQQDIDYINSQDNANELYIVAREFANFMGTENDNFTYLLTDLWDTITDYQDHLQKDVLICDPTVSLIGGTTTQGLIDIFPPQALNTGILSRIILVYGERSKKVTFPEMDMEALKRVKQSVHKALTYHTGELKITKEGKELLEKLYNNTETPEDGRLQHYAARRLDHLIKLLITMAAMDGRKEIEPDLILYGNSILAYTEDYMPKALGHYGVSRNAYAVTEIVEALNTTTVPLTAPAMWERFSHNFDTLEKLTGLISSLTLAKKIQAVTFVDNEGRKLQGYLPIRNTGKLQRDKSVVDFGLLREFQEA